MELEYTDHYIVVVHANRGQRGHDGLSILRVPVCLAWAEYFFTRWMGERCGRASLVTLGEPHSFWFTEHETCIADWADQDIGQHHYIVEAIRTVQPKLIETVPVEFLASLHEQGSL